MEQLEKKELVFEPKKIILRCSKCGSTYLLNFPSDFIRNERDTLPSIIANEKCHCGDYLAYDWDDCILGGIPRLRYLWWKLRGKVK